MYDLQNYETVKERKAKFYEKYPDGRIIVKNITPADQYMEYALFEATVYRTGEDQSKGLPASTGYAMEIRDKELKIGSKGKYESVNFSSWTENCEESSVGRGLDNLGFSGNKKASRDEMQKAQRMTTTIQKQAAKPETPNDLGKCPKCGASMIISPRTGKPYCSAKCWLNKTKDIDISEIDNQIPKDQPF